MTGAGYEVETADAARDSIAFVLAVHRGDAEALTAIFNNCDKFDLPHLIATQFIAFVEAMEVSSPQAPAFQSRAQAQEWAAQRAGAFFEQLQRDARAGRTW